MRMPSDAALWEGAGGIFIHHRHVHDTLRQQAALFPARPEIAPR